MLAQGLDACLPSQSAEERLEAISFLRSPFGVGIALCSTIHVAPQLMANQYAWRNERRVTTHASHSGIAHEFIVGQECGRCISDERTFLHTSLECSQKLVLFLLDVESEVASPPVVILTRPPMIKIL